MTSRLLPVEGTYNLRELGGFRADGGRTRFGTLFRSDALAALGDRGREQLAELGVARVIDLRDDAERRFAPDALPASAALVAHPIFPSAHAHVARRLDIYGLTEVIYLEHADTLAAALGLLAGAAARPAGSTPDRDPGAGSPAAFTGATLFHCTAGKDRTGAVAALALLAVGVDRDDVLDDYAASEANLRGAWLEEHTAIVRARGIEITPEIAGLLGTTPADALERALVAVEREHGSVRDYLRAAGFTDAGIERLHAALVE